MTSNVPSAQKSTFSVDVLEQYGEERIFEDLFNGLQITEIAEMMGLNTTGRVYSWLYRNPQRKARYKAFRQAMADQLVDQTIDLADNMPTDNGFIPVAKAKEQIKVRQWTASAWDKETYGNRNAPTQVVTQLNIGSMHLQALKQRGTDKRLPPREDEIIVDPLPPSEGP